ncbi:MAG: Bor family protein [Bacteroidota bacterium]
MRLHYLFLFVFVIALSGCYHAQVNTGRTPGTVVIDKPFASGWIYGLVPPSTVNAASECANGVAIVETQLSFVNQLVSFLTFGIYTPMHIKVTCAAAGASSMNGLPNEKYVPADATDDQVIATFSAAADEAAETGEPVAVRFSPHP